MLFKICFKTCHPKFKVKTSHSVNATDQAGILHLSGSFHTTFKDSKKMCIAFLA